MYYKRLTELRVANNLSKRDVAKAFNVAESTYGKWELGHREPNIETIRKLAEYYNVTTDYLLGETEAFTASDKKRPAGEGEPIDPMVQRLLDLTQDLTEEEATKVSEYMDLLMLKRNQQQTPPLEA